MTAGLTTIIIPTYQHAAYIADAIESALAQTAPCEVLVVDDGSTDETSRILERFDTRIRSFATPHRGPSAARNLGLERAHGEFVMWLDADDVLSPRKVEAQRLEFLASPDAGWVLCDVSIVDEGKGRQETASDRYNYRARELSGWIDRMLEASNFIPIMSPLVRRSAIGDLRFVDAHDGTPEDWIFWQHLSKVARVRYVDQVLATYRKRKAGRNRLPKQARAIDPNIEHPLRLNLGCGTPGTRSWHPIRGFVNLDKSLGWRFEDGLPEFANASVAGITISHALMYLPEPAWPTFLSECARVLQRGGVLRITEDDTVHPTSARRGGWKGSESAITLTSPAFVRTQLERAGFTVFPIEADRSHYVDLSLCQAQHGLAPDVFFVEGMRDRTVLFSPHCDDETLFAAFSILRYRPDVVICYPSTGDYGETEVRLQETRDAMQVLGGRSVEHWDGRDLEAKMRALDDAHRPERVLAPHAAASHPDHVAVAQAARAVFGSRVIAYHTYDAMGKVRKQGHDVPFEPAWIGQKLRALSRYETQIAHPRASQFFTWDLLEYVEERG